VPFVLAFTAFAITGYFVLTHQRLNAGWRHIQELAHERGIDCKAIFAAIQFHRLSHQKSPSTITTMNTNIAQVVDHGEQPAGFFFPRWT